LADEEDYEDYDEEDYDYDEFRDYVPYEDEQPSNKGLSFEGNLVFFAMNFGSLILCVLILVLLPFPYNIAGPLLFVLTVTGALPAAIYDIVKKWRRR
jgi:hypothetical protein